jgi:toxin-antitoxin system PIN domain toxin
MIHLLDVNVLIAMIDPAHVHHQITNEWFAAEGRLGWATCPITQNGVLRIVGNPRYGNSPGSPAAVAPVLARLVALEGHEFWSDEITLLDSARVDADRLLNAGSITDAYLLALAVANAGALATLDRRLVTASVRGGPQALRLIAA